LLRLMYRLSTRRSTLSTMAKIWIRLQIKIKDIYIQMVYSILKRYTFGFK
jgi:hypothetical protein